MKAARSDDFIFAMRVGSAFGIATHNVGFAVESVAGEAFVACAVVAADIIVTIGVGITIVRFLNAFINVGALVFRVV